MYHVVHDFGGWPRSVDNGSHNELKPISGPGFKDWLRGFKVRERKGKTQSETRDKETKR